MRAIMLAEAPPLIQTRYRFNRSLQRLSPGDRVSPLAFPDMTLPVADLLPPAGD